MRQRLTAAPVGHLATVGKGGRPHVVPLCFVLEGDAIYWAVDQKPKSTRRLRRLHNLAAQSSAELVVDHYEEDWNRLWWVRVTAEAAILPEGEETERALDLLAAKYEQYRRARPPGPVVRLTIQGWTGWSAA